MSRDLGLKTKLFSAFGLAVVLSMAALGAYNLHNGSQLLRDSAKQSNIIDLENRVNDINSKLKSVSEDTVFISNIPAVNGILRSQKNDGIDPFTGSTFRQWVDSFERTSIGLMNVKSQILEIGFVDKENNEISHIVRGEKGDPYGTDVMDLREEMESEFYTKVRETKSGEVLISKFMLSKIDEEIVEPIVPELKFLTPVKSDSGTFVGSIIVTYSANEILANLPRVAETGQSFYLIDGIGRFARSSDENLEFGHELESRKNAKKTSIFSEEELSSIETGKSKTFDSIHMDSMLIYSAIFPDSNNLERKWHLVTAIPFKVINSKLSSFKIMFAIITFCSFTLVMFLVYFLVNSITKPFRKILKILGDIARDNSATSSQLSESSQGVASSSVEQAAAIQESVSAMGEMNSMIAKTLEQVSNSEDTIRSVADKTTSGRDTMDELTDSMSRLGVSIGDIKDSTGEMVEQTNTQLERITVIIDLISVKATIINDIVKETQLLSFNASIEAARAGQHGKGFAVVAQEVGNLARVSGKAAEEIDTLLNDSKKEVSEIIKTTNVGLNRCGICVDEGSMLSESSSGISKQAREMFTEIADDIGEISNQVEAVKHATEEQKQGIEQVSIAMHQMDETTQHNNRIAEKSMKLATRLNGQSASLAKVRQAMDLVVSGEIKKTKIKKKKIIKLSKVDKLLVIDEDSQELDKISTVSPITESSSDIERTALPANPAQPNQNLTDTVEKSAVFGKISQLVGTFKEKGISGLTAVYSNQNSKKDLSEKPEENESTLETSNRKNDSAA